MFYWDYLKEYLYFTNRWSFCLDQLPSFGEIRLSFYETSLVIWMCYYSKNRRWWFWSGFILRSFVFVCLHQMVFIIKLNCLYLEVIYYSFLYSNREITEVELEAIAVSRLGRVYDKVLKLKDKAKEYYKHSVQLAHSMYPRTFAMEGVLLYLQFIYFRWH